MAFMTGNDANDYAILKGMELRKFRDPMEDARVLSVEVARQITREDPGLVYLHVNGSHVVSEMQRVFGAHADCDWIEAHRVHVLLDGWAEWVTYDIVPALHVLGRFAAGYGASESGDAKVCAALEDACAVVDSR